MACELKYSLLHLFDQIAPFMLYKSKLKKLQFINKYDQFSHLLNKIKGLSKK